MFYDHSETLIVLKTKKEYDEPDKLSIQLKTISSDSSYCIYYFKIMYKLHKNNSNPDVTHAAQQSSADLAAALKRLLGNHDREVALFVLCAEDHAFRNESGQSRRLQVNNYHYALSDHLLGSVMRLDA